MVPISKHTTPSLHALPSPAHAHMAPRLLACILIALLIVGAMAGSSTVDPRCFDPAALRSSDGVVDTELLASCLHSLSVGTRFGSV